MPDTTTAPTDIHPPPESVPDLVGLTEISERLGISRNTPNVWRIRGQFPAPDLELAMGPLWLWHRIEEWARSTGRRP